MNDIIYNQKRINKCLKIELTDTFYELLEKVYLNEFKKVIGFNLSVSNAFENFMFNNVYTFAERSDNKLALLFLTLLEESDIYNALRVIWDNSDETNFIYPHAILQIDYKEFSFELKGIADYEKALLYLNSSNNLYVHYDLNWKESEKLFVLINEKMSVSIEDYIVFLNCVVMYQDIDLKIYNKIIQKLKNILANCQ